MSDLNPGRQPASSGSPRSAAPRRKAGSPKGRAQPIVRSAKDYLIMFRERWYWGFAAFLLIGGGLIFLQMQKPKTFSSSTKLLFDPPIKPMNVESVRPEDINLATHKQQLLSVSFRNEVIAMLTPQEIERIRAPYLNPELSPSEQPSVAEIVGGALEVAEDRDAPILILTAYHRDPDTAVLLANKFASRYIEYYRDRTVTINSGAYLSLESDERKLTQQLQQIQDQLQAYREKYSTTSLEESRNVVAQKLTAVANERNAAQNERYTLQTTLQQVQEMQKKGGDLTEITYVHNYGPIPSLLKDIYDLQSERSLLDQRYLENHPKIRANQEALEAKQRVLKDAIARAVAELQNRYNLAVQNEQQILKRLDEAQQEVLELDAITSEYNNLRAKEQSTAGILQEVLRRKNELMMIIPLGNVQITQLDSAMWATLAEPKLTKSLVQGVLVGGFFLVCIPIGLGMLDVRLKAAWEIEQFLNQNLLGEVPTIAGVSRKERAHIMAKDLDHTASEAFRGLFGQLQLNSTVTYPKVVMLTSTLPGEGKSMIGNNLAATFASHGKKTLLVDCDFRRPNLHLYYGKDNACGVLRWINAWGAVSGPVEEDPELGILPVKQNLFLLRAGGEHRRATELFETEAFGKLIDTVRQQFDVVLVDTPPLGVFPDAMLISRHCDEVIYVCRFNAVNRSKVKKTIERLTRSEAVLAGVVLNGLPTGAQSAYYDYYGYGSNDNKRYKAYYSQKR